MSSRRARWTSGVLVLGTIGSAAVASVASCAVVAGVGSDYTLAPDVSGEGSVRDGAVDATTDGLGSMDVARDATADVGQDTSADAQVDASPESGPDVAVEASADVSTDAADVSTSDASDGGDGCIPTTEECTNGVDDDCNGLIDCADPHCQTLGFTCTSGPIPPQGWTLVAFDPTGEPACPGPYGNAGTAYSIVDAGPAACGASCVCSGTSATVSGSLTLYSGMPFLICNGSAASTRTLPVAGDGGCQTVTGAALTFRSDAGYEISDPAGLTVEQGTCAGSTAMTLPAVGFDQGETCGSTGPVGAGCDAGASCAAPPGGGFSVCILGQAGSSCPTGFPHPTLVSATMAVKDTRTCDCHCGTNASVDYGTLNVYGSSTCTGSPFGITKSCSEPGAFSVGSWYTVDVTLFNPSCAQTAPPGSSGGVAPQNAMMVCCP